MQIPPQFIKEVKIRATEILGGEEQFRRAADQEYERVQAVWNQDTELIGRILRSHLFVEHFLTEFIRNSNPALGDLTDARLSFAQKLSLLDGSDAEIQDILPGLKRLNAIRNRLAHRLDSPITPEDAAVFLSCKYFAVRQIEKQKSQTSRPSPADTLEAFARHICIVFTHRHSEIGKAMNQAILTLLPPPPQ